MRHGNVPTQSKSPHTPTYLAATTGRCFFLHIYLHISKIFRTFAPDFKIRTIMKKIFLISCVAVLAAIMCSCEKKQDPNYSVAFLMSVELKQIPVDGFYNCIVPTDRAKWSEKQLTKKDVPVSFDIDGGAAIWGDRTYQVTLQYRTAQYEEPVILNTTVTPTLAELKDGNYKTEYTHNAETEYGNVVYILHYVYY